MVAGRVTGCQRGFRARRAKCAGVWGRSRPHRDRPGASDVAPGRRGFYLKKPFLSDVVAASSAAGSSAAWDEPFSGAALRLTLTVLYLPPLKTSSGTLSPIANSRIASARLSGEVTGVPPTAT